MGGVTVVIVCTPPRAVGRPAVRSAAARDGVTSTASASPGPRAPTVFRNLLDHTEAAGGG